ncbi:MAG TPA: hypothetical protein VMR41_02115 [Patescibacteria group bacterium]|nr:hypothetical protein [Patescibacteria group bacterium]
MQPHVSQHINYYLSMLFLQVAGFFIVMAASSNIPLQMELVTLNSGIYVLWASLHQYMHHDLHPKVVLEYILVGFLGVSITFFMLRMQM